MERAWLQRCLLLIAVVMTAFLACVFALKPAYAANPTTMSFQGKVVNADGTNVTDGTYSFVFKLYTVSSAGSAIWTETQGSVSVTSGVFQVNLGSSCPFFTANACNSSTPIDFNANPNLYLGITFNSDPAGEMTPRVQLQSVPFAYNADKVGGFSASQLVQLSPGSQQSGNINISGSTTSATSVITPQLTASGALAINSGGANNVTIDSGTSGTASISLGGTNATSVGISRSGQTTTVNGALTVQQAATFNGSVIMTFQGTENLAITSDLAGAVNGVSFIGTPSTTAATTNGTFIQQANSANTNGLDNGLTIDNADTDLAIGNAINITNTGGGGYTYYLDAPNTALAGNGEIYGKGFDYFDPALLTGASTSVGGNGATTGNFGGVMASGAFIGNTDSYGQEFVGSKASTTTTNTLVGDDSKWYYGNSGANAFTAFSNVSTAGGFARLTTSTTSGRGAIITEGATAGTLDAPLLAANLPIVQMKVRPSTLVATDDLVWGMFDTAAAPTVNDTLPTNGIFFWSNNSTGATGWTAEVKNGATAKTLTCPGNATAAQFATGRIVVVNTTTVRFFIDVNASNGVTMTDCGTITTDATLTSLPAANMAMGMYTVHTSTTAGNTFDLDYARFWQDDAPVAASQAADTVASEQTQADLQTSLDEPASDINSSNLISQSSSSTVSNPSGLESASPVQQSGYQLHTSSDGSLQFVNADGDVKFSLDAEGSSNLAGNLSLADADVRGGLSVGGDSNFAGLTSFQKLATFFAKVVFRQDVQVQGHLALSKDGAGYALLRRGEQTVHVTFDKAYEDSPVVSASITNGQFENYTLDHVTTRGFDISLAVPATDDATFSWTAVGVNDPVTSRNQLTGQAPPTAAN
jgi:hypothetical protein